MTTTAYPIAPPVENLRGTLLDAALVENEIVRGAESLVDVYQSFNCMKFQESPEFCAPNDKDLDQVATGQDAFLFGAYGGVTCKTIGMDDLSAEDSAMKREVGRVFEAGESTAIEMALMAERFVANAAGDSPTPGEWGAPVDVNSAGAVHPRVALAYLEGHAASNYVGTPTIHMPRVIASLLASVAALEWDGNVLRTKLGSKVAAGGGYDLPNTSPTGTANVAGERWMYATGTVMVRRGELVLRQAIDHPNNDVFVLAERPYIVSVDCYASAVRSTVAA